VEETSEQVAGKSKIYLFLSGNNTQTQNYTFFSL